MTREQLEARIEAIRQEMRKAGPVHYRDLRKHLKRLTAQMRQYDRFQAAAEQGVA